MCAWFIWRWHCETFNKKNREMASAPLLSVPLLFKKWKWHQRPKKASCEFLSRRVSGHIWLQLLAKNSWQKKHWFGCQGSYRCPRWTWRINERVDAFCLFCKDKLLNQRGLIVTLWTGSCSQRWNRCRASSLTTANWWKPCLRPEPLLTSKKLNNLESSEDVSLLLFPK